MNFLKIVLQMSIEENTFGRVNHTLFVNLKKHSVKRPASLSIAFKFQYIFPLGNEKEN